MGIDFCRDIVTTWVQVNRLTNQNVKEEMYNYDLILIDYDISDISESHSGCHGSHAHLSHKLD